MPGGRPLKFKSVDELEAKIQAYFDDCDPHIEEVKILEKKSGRKSYPQTPDEYVETTIKQISRQKPYTVTGLAVALDCDRDTLLNYEEREEFFGTIKRAKAKIHAFVESRLFENNAAGPIFNLKNNFGWKDKTEQEISGGEDPVKLLLDKYDLKREDKNGRQDDESIQGSHKSST